MQFSNGARWLSLTSLTGITALLGSNIAFGAGFALRNESASGMATANASNTVFFGDASGIGSNPAVMSEFKTHAISVNLNHTMANIDAKDATLQLYNSTTGTSSASPNPGLKEVSDVSDPVNIPYLYGVHPINEQIAVGWSFTVPYGTNTEYDKTWAGRYHATKTELTTMEFGLHGSYKINDLFTAGLSLGYQKAEGELTSMVDTGTVLYGVQAQANGALGAPDATLIHSADSEGKFTGDSTAMTFGVGFLVKPMEGSTIGLSYKAAYKHEAEGDIEFSGSGTRGATALGTLRNVAAVAPIFTNGDAKVELNMPSVISLGYAHKLADFNIFANVTQTTWSSFESLDIEYGTNQVSETELNWKDSTFFGVGGDYAFSPEITFRAGLGMDKSVVGDSDRTPRTPDNDRTILALGGGYKTEKFAVDLGIQKLFIEDTDIDLKANAYADNNTRGNLKTKLEIDPLVVMLGGTFSF